MCTDLLHKLVTLGLVFATFDAVLGTDATDLPESTQEKLATQQKGRLSLQNTAEIQHCLVNAGDVGCGVFECFENNSCEIRGLHEICMTFLHNAGKFDAQGKSFIKDALKCKAHGLRHKFSCISRKCPAIKEMVLQLQRECYAKHDLCSAAKENVQVIVEMIRFKDLLLHEPYVDLVNVLLTCGDEVRDAITHSVQTQCAQSWGSLCSILSFCTSTIQGDGAVISSSSHPKKQGESSKSSRNHSESLPQSEMDRDGTKAKNDKEKNIKGHPNVHARTKTGYNPKVVYSPPERSDEPAGLSDIRR
ncbi:stanniocalcin-2 [Spea bombifrons]|uniref:stanniocalcin-2 n=1 Tax=Spea bombifrons TaxID=233779 RepID=UPI00234A6FAF|nr:stanniocalcin-2 [Spea bombifrons]